VIATNILPYFDDVELALAASNIAAMLSPGGILLHNEVRPALRAIADAAGLTLEQSRLAPNARVAGAPPLADTIWLHRRTVKECGRAAVRVASWGSVRVQSTRGVHRP
jgi:hypothetical protein